MTNIISHDTDKSVGIKTSLTVIKGQGYALFLPSEEQQQCPPKTDIRPGLWVFSRNGIRRIGGELQPAVPTPNPKLDYALTYARMGWPVIPCTWIWTHAGAKHCSCNRADCDSPGKHPIGRLVPHGLKDATTDPETIRKWWGEYPNANIAVVTGERSGIVAVDIDTHKGGQTAFDQWMFENNVKLPETVTQQTGSGGLHYVFRYPAGLVVGNRADMLKGVDVRGQNGYIMVEPSCNLGGPYAWIDGEPWDSEIAELPQNLLELIGGKQKSESGAAPGVAGAVRWIIPEETVQEVIDALRFIPADLYQRGVDPNTGKEVLGWIEIGHALKMMGLGERGFQIWDDWSKKSSKYDPSVMRSKWHSFKPSDITHLSIFKCAQDLGWVNPQSMAADGAGMVFDPATGECWPEFPEAQHRPCYRTYDTKCGPGGTFMPGTYLHTFEEDAQGNKIPIDTRICDPLHIDAQCSDRAGMNYGLMLRFRAMDDRWIRWAMPREMLGGSGEEIRRTLMGKGLVVVPKQKQRLIDYLTSARPKKRMKSTSKVGWFDDNFVLPDRVIGDDTKVFLLSDRPWDHKYNESGDLETWRSSISALCPGNPFLMHCVSTAFAGALLSKCNLDGGGFHATGESSSGKSTVMVAAASVWGYPKDYINSWRATSNGLEASALMFNDGLMCLDEIGQGDAKDIAQSVYLLANGQGKQRSDRYGSSRPINTWRVMMLSNGEKGIDTVFASAKMQIATGQELRFLQIPVFGKYGAFDNLHWFSSGAELSDHLKREAARNYGVAGIAYLEKIVRDDRDFVAMFKTVKRNIITSIGALSGQEGRALDRFAIVALAGELATEYGITGWAPGAATEAVIACFRAWYVSYGAFGKSKETIKVLDAVREYVETWGDARFSDAKSGISLNTERSGWWDDSNGCREWWFTSASLKKVIEGAGLDFKSSKGILVKEGWMPITATQSKRVKTEACMGGTSKVEKVHVITIKD